MRTFVLIGCLLLATPTSAQDWPQACYNETSMWVTNACKTYIEEVYLPAQESVNAAPAPSFGAGLPGLLLLVGAAGAVLLQRRRRQGRGG